MRNLGLRSRVSASIAIISAFLLLFFLLVFTYSFPAQTPKLLGVLVSHHLEFMLLMVGIGVVVGAAIFYLMHEEVEIKEKESKVNAELALSLLNPDERKAVKLLLEKNGECLQAEVARLDGMTRLKAHRVAQSLEKRGIVALGKNGKVVTMELAANVKSALV